MKAICNACHRARAQRGKDDMKTGRGGGEREAKGEEEREEKKKKTERGLCTTRLEAKKKESPLRFSFLSLSLHGQQAALAPAAASRSRGRHRPDFDDSRDDSFDALLLGSGLGAESRRRVIDIVAAASQGRRGSPRRRPCFLLATATATAATAATSLLPHLLGLGHGGPDRPVPVPR